MEQMHVIKTIKSNGSLEFRVDFGRNKAAVYPKEEITSMLISMITAQNIEGIKYFLEWMKWSSYATLNRSWIRSNQNIRW